MKKIREALTREDGFTIIELAIASALTTVILLSALSMLDSGTKSERVSQARYQAQLTLRGAMTQITKELRQAVSVDPSSNESLLDMQTLIDGVQHRIVYRVVGSPPNAVLQRSLDGGSPEDLADRIVAPQAFCYHYSEPNCLATSPPDNVSAVRVSIKIAPVVFSEGSVTLATDVQLRNHK